MMLERIIGTGAESTSLPTTPAVGIATSLKHKHEIRASMEPDPDRLGSARAVRLSIEQAAKTGAQADHLIER